MRVVAASSARSAASTAARIANSPGRQRFVHAADGRGAEHGVDHQQHRAAIGHAQNLAMALDETADPALQCLAGDKRPAISSKAIERSASSETTMRLQ